ncbi:MAG TPA: DUF1801 domain-containing protein [Candidatus Baltobacteraceae bacterium]|nr:DUF1801 domain-containing protein [Candidatus Baltobacteraceae bacterium]
MSVIDDYLKKIEPAKRKQLQRIRTLAKEAVTGAEEVISYGIPTLTYRGKPFLGFYAHAKHIGLYPFSGQVFKTIQEQLGDYTFSSGALRIPYDDPISKRLLRKIISVRLKAIREQLTTK